MKKIIRNAFVILLAALTAVCVISVSGCAKTPAADFDEDALPKLPNDPKVTAQWDSTTALKGVPRYNGGGIFDVIAEINENEANVYYDMTSSVDYLGYIELLTKAGYKLKDGSSVWSSEGVLGVPQYFKEHSEIRLVWNSDGSFAICVKRV